MGLLDRFLSAMRPPTQTRESGPPRSSNGASSMHARWLGPLDGAEAAEVELTIVDPPAGRHLHFWALQASFYSGRRRLGGAHLGLQWIAGHPGSTAANWGGYGADGSILDGTQSDLPSALNNPHTRDFVWQPGRAYRLRIDREMAGWRGSIIDTSTGDTTVIRELLPGGDRLGSFVMWSEVFAPCEGPSTAVAWSSAAVERGGTRFDVADFELNYQSYEDGGCTNTNTSIEALGGRPHVVQRTAVARVEPVGSTLHLGR